MRRDARSSFHEDLGRRHAVRAGSDRAFGLIVGGFLCVFGLIRLWTIGAAGASTLGLLAAGVLLAVLGLVAPRLLGPLNRLWIRFGLLLNRIVSPIVLGVLFYGVVMPTGLLMRLFGKRPLRLARDPEAPTYWIERTPPGPLPETMKQQF